MITHAVLAVALTATLVPAGEAPGPRMFRNRDSGLCLTWGTQVSTGKTIAATGNCDPRSKYMLWKRTTRSQLANRTTCLSSPTGPQDNRRVLVRRCGKADRLTFARVRRGMDGEHLRISWKNGQCLVSNYRGHVHPGQCSNIAAEWVVVRWSMD
ncbi:hypothetical protein ACFWY5_39795 [Nonomuraea sp. NPDC059007]|uniref:hypothetical protein n=1 Tax=Nonomuraea sp. NPDC059007 TaxID=3346692 RepID=UPI0036A032F6